jgi:peptide/nickel transport system permease protein
MRTQVNSGAKVKDRARRFKSSFFVKTVSEPSGLLGFLLVILFMSIALFAPQISPYDPNKIDIANRFLGPTPEHLFGTDQIGRDLLSRVIFGSKVALKISLPTVGTALTIGLILGIIAGLFPGYIDNFLIVVFDIIRSFPTVVLALAMLVLFGSNLTNLILIIAFSWFPGYARVARGETLRVKNNDYVEAARAQGASNMRIMFRHILPNIIGPLIILGAMDIPAVITIESGLSFLGLGVRPPMADWGTILSDGYHYIYESPWIIIFPGLALTLATLGFTLFGETLRDILDPKLRRLRQ